MKLCLAFVATLALFAASAEASDAAVETVSKHGRLSVRGTQLVDQNGNPVMLKGMSLYWSQWKPQYWNPETIQGIHDSCHGNVVRAAMAVDNDGYLTNPEAEMAKVEAVIQAAIQNDIYVVVDWHEEQADQHQTQAVEFFSQISRKYGAYPNVLYETFNEPTSQGWSSTLKPYHEAVIRAIRANDPNNVIICGTGTYSQRVDEAADDPITISSNIMYTLHFYAGAHKQWLRDLADGALAKGIAIFVTEYGTTDVVADAPVEVEETNLWWNWCEANNISHCNWSVSDVDENTASQIANTPADKVCQSGYLTTSGALVVEHNRS